MEGGRGWEIMDGLEKTMDVWLGEEPTKRLREHLEHVKQVRGLDGVLSTTTNSSLRETLGRSNELLISPKGKFI